MVVSSLPEFANAGQTKATGWSRPTAPSLTASRNASAAKGFATEKVITSVSGAQGEDPSRVPAQCSISTSPSCTRALRQSAASSRQPQRASWTRLCATESLRSSFTITTTARASDLRVHVSLVNPEIRPPWPNASPQGK